MIRINKIEILGFKDPDKKVTVNFSDGQVSVIFGENGCGKTTLLRIIHSILLQDESILMSEKVKRVNLNYSVYEENELIEQRNSCVYINESINKNDIENGTKLNYVWEGFITKELEESSSILFGVNRGVTSNITNKINEDVIERFMMRSSYPSKLFGSRALLANFSKELSNFLNDTARRQRRYSNIENRPSYILDTKNLIIDNLNIDIIEEVLIERYRLAEKITSERVQKALFDTLSIAINPKGHGNEKDSNIPDNFHEILIKNKDRLIEALKNSAENTLRNEIIEILNNYSRENESTRINPSNKLLCNLLLKMINELEREQAILDSINLLVEVFNDQLSKDKKLFINRNGACIKLTNGTHGLNDLSSGERHLLTFLTMFIIKGSKRDLLMIDEPEISLNIKWQRRLIELLQNLAPNSQIILASHSPSISVNSLQLVEIISE